MSGLCLRFPTLQPAFSRNECRLLAAQVSKAMMISEAHRLECQDALVVVVVAMLQDWPSIDILG